MRKKFLVNLALLVFLNLLVKPFWIFGIDRTVQNTVGLTDYGFYFTLFNFAFLFNILLDAGITNFNNRNIAQHRHLLNKHFSRIFVVKLFLALVYIVFTFAVALAIGYDADKLRLLAWVALNQMLLSMILYLRSNISGLLMFTTDSFMSVLDRILMIGICSVLLWGGVSGQPFRIEWFVYAQTASYLATFIVALLIVVRKAAFRRLTLNLPFILVILRKSFPFALLVLLMSIYNRVDAVFLERMLEGDTGEQQAGLYASAFRILDAANQFAWLFAVLLLPIYSRMIKDGFGLEEMIRLPYSIMVTFGMLLTVGSLFYSREIMGLLYPRSAGEGLAAFTMRLDTVSAVFRILMFSFLGTCTMYIFSTLLTANGNLRQLNIIALGGIIVNFALNLILIPKMMALGSAIASLVTQVITAGFQVLAVRYVMRPRLGGMFAIRLLAYASLTVVFGMVSVRLHFDWKYSFLLFCLATLLSAMMLRLLNFRAFLGIIREKGQS